MKLPKATPNNQLSGIKVLIFALFSLCLLSSCTLSDILEGGSNSQISREDKIAMGLKEALKVGIEKTTDSLHQVNGYLGRKAIALILPDDVQKIFGYCKSLNTNPLLSSFLVKPLLKLEDSLLISLNRAAELAAPRSLPIFSDAIRSLTINDVMGIFRGDSVAATRHFQNETSSQLITVYTPLIDSALARVSAVGIWEKFSTQYNSLVEEYNAIPLALRQELGKPPTLTTNLSTYTTKKAMDGLFYMVGQQEALIRKDPVARVTDILKEVFGELDKTE